MESQHPLMASIHPSRLQIVQRIAIHPPRYLSTSSRFTLLTPFRHPSCSSSPRPRGIFCTDLHEAHNLALLHRSNRPNSGSRDGRLNSVRHSAIRLVRVNCNFGMSGFAFCEVRGIAAASIRHPTTTKGLVLAADLL